MLAWGPVPPSRPRRPWWPWLLAGAAVILVVALAAVFLWPRGGGTPAPTAPHPTAPLETPAPSSSGAPLPPDATPKTLDEITLPEELAGWTRVSSEPARGTVVRSDRYGRDGAVLTIAAVRQDTLAHATAGLVDPIDGPSFRCSSVQPQRCWAQAADGVVTLGAPAGVDAVALMELLVAQL